MSTILLALSISILGATASPENLQEGDLVFQESRSGQSVAVSAATHSPLTHMGVITIIKGSPYVFEAVAPATGRVGATPFSAWRARGVRSRVWVKRLKDHATILTPPTLKRMKEVANSFVGRPYDKLFRWGTEKLYCSELVYNVYLVGAGLSVGAVQQVRDLDLEPPSVQRLIRARLKKRLDTSDLIITPAMMFSDSRLETVMEPAQ